MLSLNFARALAEPHGPHCSAGIRFCRRLAARTSPQERQAAEHTASRSPAARFVRPFALLAVTACHARPADTEYDTAVDLSQR